MEKSIGKGAGVALSRWGAREFEMTVACAWIGLGVMGFPMAGHLAKKSGAAVTVYNRSADKAGHWQKTHGNQTAPTPKAAAEDADFVFACVGNDDDLRAVTIGPEGAFQSMKRGAIFVDHTTASADVARELAATAAEKGLGFIDAPVSGGQAGAENGMLTVMCGGDETTYAKAEPLIMSYARMSKLLGWQWCRPARQDVQPDRHCGPGAGSR